MQRLFGERWPLWRKAEVEERLLRSPEAQGCLVVPHYFGLNPLRYVRGLAAAAVRRGAAVHAGTPVTAWQRTGDRHRLTTPGGTVTAERVLVATNGYTPEGLDPALLRGRVLPALSSIVVTRPLTPAEQAAQGWTRPALVADSRNLLFYIRLLRDGRLLFGARGGVDASPDAFARRCAWMERRLGEKFPAWRGVTIEHAWWGLVCLARDLLPHLGWLDPSGAPRSRPWPTTAAASPSPPCSAAPRRRRSPAATPTRRCRSSCSRRRRGSRRPGCGWWRCGRPISGTGSRTSGCDAGLAGKIRDKVDGQGARDG